MLIKWPKVVALSLIVITLVLPLPVSSKPIPITIHVDIGRKRFDCTRAGICGITVGADVSLGSARSSRRTVKGTAEVAGRQMAISFGSELPEKGELLPIDEDIILDEETAKALGFKTVTVLKGEYRINRRGNKLGVVSLNVRTTK